jgi:hypothetical protein
MVGGMAETLTIRLRWNMRVTVKKWRNSASITPENLHAEVDFGAPAGEEAKGKVPPN